MRYRPPGADPNDLRRYNVGARKLPHDQRDVAHSVITATDDRGFRDVIDADDDPTVPIGAKVAYTVELTEAEAQAFREASNCRYVEPDGRHRMAVVDVTPVTGVAAVGEQSIPPDSTLRWMGVSADIEAAWHGTDVAVAVLDGGTTATVRNRFAWRLLAHRNFAGTDTNPDAITVEHGCWVTPLAVPPGGRLVQAVVFDNEGYGYNSGIAAAVKWAVDAGARVVNFSGGGGGPAAVLADAFAYAAARGAVVVCSAGNSGRPELEYPSRYSETQPGVKSSIAFVEATDVRAEFSNYAVTGSGAAPGQQVLTIGRDGNLVRVSGTSFSSPHMARLIAMGSTGGRYAPTQVAQALQATARDTLEPDPEEGAGAWHLEAALRTLGGSAPKPFPVDDVRPWLDKRYNWTRVEGTAKTAIRDWLSAT